MTNDELETLLRAWGRVLGERPVRDDDGEHDSLAFKMGMNPIARGMEFAPGKRQAVIRQRTSMNRDGRDRRTTMAVAANAGCRLSIRVVSAGYVDPVPCVETRSHRSEASDWPVPPQIARVERAALDLQAFNDFRGRCLRVNYCTRGSHEDKVLRLGIALGEDVKLKRYRDEVSYARVWMHARLAA